MQRDNTLLYLSEADLSDLYRIVDIWHMPIKVARHGIRNMEFGTPMPGFVLSEEHIQAVLSLLDVGASFLDTTRQDVQKVGTGKTVEYLVRRLPGLELMEIDRRGETMGTIGGNVFVPAI